MEKSESVRSKIIKVAHYLFYKKGYSETGINEILKESTTFKKSFYNHFPSKEDLGVEYINLIQTDLTNLLQKLLDKHPQFENFTKAWLNLIKKKILKNYSKGCPLANLPTSSEILRKQIQIAFARLKEPLAQYFINNYGFTKEKAKRVSEEILFLYEGALNSYKLDPHVKYFDYLDGAVYPDGGASVEIYTNNRMLELESLGPLTLLEPGESVEHVEIWRLFKGIPAEINEDVVDEKLLSIIEKGLED
ncbi:MAG: TetR/AcrR family transcriptional regulator [Leptospiraceae bacterium]|nr:TetR/AcrR family transcriptional regulator [Leptospiraceae bacterium]